MDLHVLRLRLNASPNLCWCAGHPGVPLGTLQHDRPSMPLRRCLFPASLLFSPPPQQLLTTHIQGGPASSDSAAAAAAAAATLKIPGAWLKLKAAVKSAAKSKREAAHSAASLPVAAKTPTKRSLKLGSHPHAKHVSLNTAVHVAESDANKALSKATTNAIQAALMRAALSVPGVRSRRREMAKEQAIKAAEQPSAAWLAGAKAWAARNPIPRPVINKPPAVQRRVVTNGHARVIAVPLGQKGKMALAGQDSAEPTDPAGEEEEEEAPEPAVSGTAELGTPVAISDVQPHWSYGTRDPSKVFHTEDRYVPSGEIMPGRSEVAEEQEAAVRGGVQQLAAAKSGNSADAPTLEGGISVPGGRVVWLPISQLESASNSDLSKRARMVSEREAGPMSTTAAQGAWHRAPVGEAGGVPVPPFSARKYSEEVVYGPNGLPAYALYGAGAAQVAAAQTPKSASAKRGGHARMQSGEDESAESEPERWNGELSTEDRAIENKVLLKLLREQQLENQEGAAGHVRGPNFLLLWASTAVALMAGAIARG